MVTWLDFQWEVGYLGSPLALPLQVGRGSFSRAPSMSILSRDPIFAKNHQQPGETAGFCKERWLKRMGNQRLDFYKFVGSIHGRGPVYFRVPQPEPMDPSSTTLQDPTGGLREFFQHLPRVVRVPIFLWNFTCTSFSPRTHRPQTRMTTSAR